MQSNQLKGDIQIPRTNKKIDMSQSDMSQSERGDSPPASLCANSVGSSVSSAFRHEYDQVLQCVAQLPRFGMLLSPSPKVEEVQNASIEMDASTQLSRVTATVDECATLLKSRVLQEFNCVRDELLQQSQLAAQAEKNRLVSQLNMSQTFANELREQLTMSNQLLKDLSNALKLSRNSEEAARQWADAKVEEEEQRREDFCEKLAQNLDRRQKLRRALFTWRGRLEETWRQRVERACRVKSEEVCATLAEDYETRLATQRSEIEHLRQVVQEAECGRLKAQDQVREILLRGLSALNIESLEGASNDFTEKCDTPESVQRNKDETIDCSLSDENIKSCNSNIFQISKCGTNLANSFVNNAGGSKRRSGGGVGGPKSSCVQMQVAAESRNVRPHQVKCVTAGLPNGGTGHAVSRGDVHIASVQVQRHHPVNRATLPSLLLHQQTMRETAPVLHVVQLSQ